MFKLSEGEEEEVQSTQDDHLRRYWKDRDQLVTKSVPSAFLRGLYLPGGAREDMHLLWGGGHNLPLFS